MKKGLIKSFAKSSYTKNEIDKEKVEKIIKYLNKSSLKEYIRDLKTLENKRTVTISLSSEEDLNEVRKIFSKIYPKRKIIVKIDSELIAGIKVVDYDNEYEISLKDFLTNSLNYITQND